jgi:organic hydroperoxide reductase OsmC/OhrA
LEVCGRESEALAFEVELLASVPGLGDEAIRELLEAAHEVGPYSRATRGKIAVKLSGG